MVVLKVGSQATKLPLTFAPAPVAVTTLLGTLVELQGLAVSELMHATDKFLFELRRKYHRVLMPKAQPTHWPRLSEPRRVGFDSNYFALEQPKQRCLTK